MTPTSRQETMINLKINFDGKILRFRLPLRELLPLTLPEKLRDLLRIPPESMVVFERYSDSAGTYISLEPNNTSAYKQLYRAAKAKLRLRLRATVVNSQEKISDNSTSAAQVENNNPNEASSQATPKNNDGTASITKSPDQMKKSDLTHDVQPNLENLHICDQLNDVSITNDTTTGTEDLESKQTAENTNSKVTVQGKCPYFSSIVEKDGHLPAYRECSDNKPTLRSLTLEQILGNEIVKENSTSILTDDLLTKAVMCNNCKSLINGEHYHCSNCDDGDYDLCQTCIENGNLCYVESHWLIKRVIENGKLVNSVTQTMAPKSQSQPKENVSTNQNSDISIAIRACNCCVREFTEEHFVTCTTCPDYDLCMSCHISLKHGHHPNHAFIAVDKDKCLDLAAQNLLASGRNTEHDATCDGCNKFIFGVRHKCLDCPDWDYCSSCFSNANSMHPRHRFVPIYENSPNLYQPISQKFRHHGVFCDGPLCKNISTYIWGDRYKCAVCDDTDFCASCEASPENKHDDNHPLIKFRIPVSQVSVTTIDGQDIQQGPTLGDKRSDTCETSEAKLALNVNTPTQVHTIYDLNPPEILNSERVEITEDSSLLVESKTIADENLKSKNKPVLRAEFVRDTITDGTSFPPNEIFKQTWYLRNCGTDSWPRGCYVKFVAGKNMSFVNTQNLNNFNEHEKAAISSISDTEVAPGEMIGFTVLLKAPCDPGNFISHWRLVTSDDVTVGTNLWCDINVQKAAPILKKDSKKESANESSQLIFPALENEGPLKNVQESNPKLTEMEDFEFSTSWGSSDEHIDDLFLTDDEYDILDASDEYYFTQ
ncbi:putative zz type zinc finger domain-containing protein [Golovinomyces cichoracearum]|uniref:Putative zz type zinc finger domain-containing protein n=1 Tax=Golovinomyces cichoracearum TaxID=62708 RepID=A0A420ICN7_9PEZI|nr:putative zz type zinc finger domain-containing protein [Golovinomyces cichoracearum]